VNAICNGLENCDYENILFYNPVESPYCQSVEEGVANGFAQLNTYHSRCPNTKLVLSGYSQGSQVVSDIIGGGSGVFFQGCTTTPTAPLDVNSELGRKIAAVVTFGNTRHTANQPYNQFSGAPDNGIFPRPNDQLANLAKWTSKYHDYCVAEDPICAGGNVVADHLNYYDLYSNVAAEWVKSELSAADAVVTSTLVSSSSTFTSVATVPTDKTVATSFAYSNNTASAASIPASSVLASIRQSVLPVPTTSSTVTVTVDSVSVNTVAVASYTSAWISTATVSQTAAASISGADKTGGAAASKTSSAANGTHTLAPFTGAASSLTGAASGSLALVLLSAVALLL
jgi:hypothetical protein